MTTLLGAESLVYVFAILVFHSLVLFSLQNCAALGDGDNQRSSAAEESGDPLIIGLVLGALLNFPPGLPEPSGVCRMAGAGGDLCADGVRH
ncbi:hypothetical protein [Stutzerimonas xanthomarina]|uniref:hypothetical protein n=1 Tax=Stutzerimonas xanthomarina TaxID=271420 RepID=UPI003AA8C255